MAINLNLFDTIDHEGIIGVFGVHTFDLIALFVILDGRMVDKSTIPFVVQPKDLKGKC
jgi:hypothetical protein